MKYFLILFLITVCSYAIEPKTWKPAIERKFVIVEDGQFKIIKIRQEMPPEELRKMDLNNDGYVSERERVRYNKRPAYYNKRKTRR